MLREHVGEVSCVSAVAEALGSRKGTSLLSTGLEAESPLRLEGWERTVRVG